MEREFADEGYVLDVEEPVLDHIVFDALRRETGARGLASTLTRHLEDVAFECFGAGRTGTVHVQLIDDAIDVDVTDKA